MTEPQRRTTAIDAAISNLNSQLAKLVDERRALVRDVNASPEKLAKMNTEIQALRDKVGGQQELRAEAAKLDARDAFLRERAALKKRAEVLGARLKRERVAAARKVDQACALLGEGLREMQEHNEATWREFVGVAQALGLPKRAVDSAISTNQSRIGTSSIGMTALVHALKGAGLGVTGIQAGMAGDVFSSLQTFPTWSAWNPGQAMTVAQAMEAAADRVKLDLANLFAQAEASVDG